MRDRKCQKFALGDCDEACSAPAYGCIGVSCATKFGNGKQNTSSNFSPTRCALFGLIKCDLELEPFVENSTRNLQENIAPSGVDVRNGSEFACLKIEARPEACNININSTVRMLNAIDFRSRRKIENENATFE